MAKHQKQLSQSHVLGQATDGKLADTVIATAVRSGAPESAVAEQFDMPVEQVKQIVRRTPVSREVLAETKARLPADLFAVADYALQILLRPDAHGKLTKLEELNGVELARMITYSIHNARLLSNESTQNVFNLSAIVSQINPTQPMNATAAGAESGKMVGCSGPVNATGTKAGEWAGYGAEGAKKPIHPETGSPADPCTVLDQQMTTNLGGYGKSR